jgi:hypothetical protein
MLPLRLETIATRVLWTRLARPIVHRTSQDRPGCQAHLYPEGRFLRFVAEWMCGGRDREADRDSVNCQVAEIMGFVISVVNSGAAIASCCICLDQTSGRVVSLLVFILCSAPIDLITVHS